MWKKHSNTYVAGTTYGNRQIPIASLSEGSLLVLKPEPTNQHDPRAIAVLSGDRQIGYLPSDVAKSLLPGDYRAVVTRITTVDTPWNGQYNCKGVIVEIQMRTDA